MTDRSKFEEMLERLVNEDREGAEALFHEIVVERSREIYQSILESDDEDLEEADDEDLDESDDEELDESANDDEDLEESDDEDLDESEDEDLDEMFGLDEFEMEADPMGGDATDDMMGDLGMGDEGDMDMGDEGDMDGGVEDRVQDLEDALEDLKAEFEAMMSGDDAGDDMDMDDEGDDADMDDEGDEEEPEEEAFTYESKKADKKADEKKEKKTAGEEMREYVEKVNGGFGAKIGGDNGANSKSTVASKNDMGGTTANILRADTENSGEAGKGHLKGSSLFKGTAKEDNAGNMNVPGAKAGKTAFKKSEPGHGAEKKGKPETADKGAHSTIRTTVRSK
jgi:hypothetical protein